MAEILLAERVGENGFKQRVVLKRLLPHLAENPDFVTTLIDEARIASRIKHKNVVRVFDLERDQEQLYLVMEYVDGKTLLDLFKNASGALSFQLAAHVVAEACAGLHAAHELGIVHRDIAPSNVLVSRSGEVRVLDFGIATCIDRLGQTRRGWLKGKFAYFPPERIEGRKVDRRADVFGLGILLYELTLRRRLFKRASDVACLQAILSHDVIPPTDLLPTYPVELERIVMRALAHDRNDRYPSAEELRRDLLAFAKTSESTRPPQEELGSILRAMDPRRPKLPPPSDEPSVPVEPSVKIIVQSQRKRRLAAALLALGMAIFAAVLMAAAQRPEQKPIRIEVLRQQTVEPVVIDVNDVLTLQEPMHDVGVDEPETLVAEGFR
jgi:serine/threonine-protein kinase